MLSKEIESIAVEVAGAASRKKGGVVQVDEGVFLRPKGEGVEVFLTGDVPVGQAADRETLISLIRKALGVRHAGIVNPMLDITISVA